MFLNTWSLTLNLCSLVVLALMIPAARTAVRVLRFWNPASDDNRQIRLEAETWLASTLVEYALFFQIVTLVLFVLAADHFCQVIVGAMCATGALLADDYGIPALIVKLAGVFMYGFWIVLHQLDIRSEDYPLVRAKYSYLLFLLPVLLLDITLQTLYLAGLKPDIITSCCAVVFNKSTGGGPNLLGGFSQGGVLAVFYGAAFLLTVLGLFVIRRWRLFPALMSAAVWAGFLGVSLVAITSVFSSYIYAMPFHHCPFCILKPQYHYIGYAIYGTLLPAVFFGITAVLSGFCQQRGLEETATRFRRTAVIISLFLLGVFVVLVSYHFVLYRIAGGEM